MKNQLASAIVQQIRRKNMAKLVAERYETLAALAAACGCQASTQRRFGLVAHK